jgi:hypothetical protein
MRKRLLIVAGIIALAGMLVLMIPGKQHRPVTLQLLGKTNIGGTAHCVVLVSNRTDELRSCMAWMEHNTDGLTWSPDFTLQQRITNFPLFANGSSRVELKMPSYGKTRVTVVYGFASKGERGRLWLWRARGLVGLASWEENRLQVEVE